MMALHIGGIEANSIMAESMRLKTLQQGRMSFQEMILYLGARSDLATYVLFENNGAADDISNYLKDLNAGREAEKVIERK
jgi:hypothetical protein